MKHYFFLVLFAILCLPMELSAETLGRVYGCNDNLNVRNEPTIVATPFWRVRDGETVTILGTSDDRKWYQVKFMENGQYQTGYISADHISIISGDGFNEDVDNEENEKQANDKDAEFNKSVSYSISKQSPHIDAWSHQANWLVYVCLALVFLCAAFCSNVTDEGLKEKALFYFVSGLFIVLSLLTIFYLYGHVDPLWFVWPDKVGWLWTIINGVLLFAFTINYLFVLMNLLGASNYHGERNCYYMFGLYSQVVTGGLWVVFVLFKSTWADYMLWALIICQILQVALYIINNARVGGDWGNLWFTLVIYFIGLFCSTLIAITILPAIIAFALLYVFLMATSGETPYDKYKEVYTDGKGLVISNERYGSDYFKGNDCHTYRRDSWGNLHRRD